MGLNRWDVATVAFALGFSSFLINLVIQDMIALIRLIRENQSQLNYKTAMGGIHDPALISFRGFKLGGLSVKVENYCNCSIKRMTDPTYNEYCLNMTDIPIYNNMVGIGSNVRQNYTDNFYEVPGNRAVGEYLLYECYHPGERGLSIASSPFGAGMKRLMEAAMHPDPNYINNFYQKHFINRPLPYNPTGYYNTLLLDKTIYLGLKEVPNEVNTRIHLQSSRTRQASEDYTEFKVAWATDVYLVVQEVSLGNVMLFFTLVATPSLLMERLITLTLKLKRKGEYFGKAPSSAPKAPPDPFGKQPNEARNNTQLSDEYDDWWM